MPSRVIVRCEFCDAAPDPLTQPALERRLRELAFGEYLDVPPGRWLVWLGGGPLGDAEVRPVVRAEESAVVSAGGPAVVRAAGPAASATSASGRLRGRR